MTRFDLLYYLATPLVLPWFAWRLARRGKYKQSASAMLGGALPVASEREAFREGSIWVHAVSVGETVAAKSIMPLLHELAPELPIVASTVTETGQAHAKRILTEADEIHYFPVDFSWNVDRFQRCYNPKIYIMMETELWPNFLSMAARRGTKVFMVNGKISDKSFRGYMRGRALLRPAFDAINAFCMQTDADAERMTALCGRPKDVFVTGNCKFDAPLPTLSEDAASGARDHYRLGPRRPTLVVGSTHPGEERIMLQAFEQLKKQVPDALMIVSPRHPERFNEVFAFFRKSSWSVSRATNPVTEAPDIFILDNMGELARSYGLGDVAIVAGSFGPVGGHNLLEAAAHSIPVVVGPNMRAQKEINRLFECEDSGCRRTTAEDLGDNLLTLFKNKRLRDKLGEQARNVAIRNQGSARASINILKKYLL